MHFGAFFYGTVDMPDAGIDGPPAHRRNYGQDDYRRAYADLIAYTKACDALGYDSVWSAEHHFHNHGFEVVPNVLLLNAVLAQHTRRVRLGALIHVLTTWHPVHFAEDYALADVLAGGRLLCGLGRGTEERESNVFGVNVGYSNNADDVHNREVFEEQVEIFKVATANERFSYRGKYYTIPPEGLTFRGRAGHGVSARSAAHQHAGARLPAHQQRGDPALCGLPTSRGRLRQPSLGADGALVATLRGGGRGGAWHYPPARRGPHAAGAGAHRRFGGGGDAHRAARAR